MTTQFRPGHDPKRHELSTEDRERAAEARREQASRLRQVREALDSLPVLERREVMQLAAAEAEACLAYLVEVRDDRSAPAYARLRATELLLRFAGYEPGVKLTLAEPEEHRRLIVLVPPGAAEGRSPEEIVAAALALPTGGETETPG